MKRRIEQVATFLAALAMITAAASVKPWDGGTDRPSWFTARP
ncbi:hypothetical protein ACFUS2_12855 [[Kitasatospora] papulosa]